MNESILKNGVVKTLLILTIMFFFLIGSAENSNAATLKTIPSTSLSVSQSNKLYFGYHNYTAKWNGVSGKMIKGTYNYDLLCVPVKSTTAAFTYTDFLDLTFTNVGKINGRQLDAKVHFNSMTVGKANTTTGLRSDKYFAVCYLADESLWISSTVDGIGAGYRAPKTIDITTTIYWHDTGQTVNLPFFQCLQDIDAGGNYFKEAWEAKSGFSGIFYKYSSCFLVFNGNKAETPSATDVGGTDSLFKGGFYAPTTGGVFRGAFTEGNCATQFIPYSAYAIMNNPVKSSDGKAVNTEGNEINYSVTQKMGKFYVDVMTVYNSFTMSDVLPKGLEYKSAKVIDDTGKDITSQGTITYDAASKKVSFKMGSTWLNDINNYKGQNLTLKISTKVEKPDAPKKTISNNAVTTIDGITLTSNKVDNVIAVPYHVSYKYVSGTSNKKLPDFISTTSGDYAISDTGTYYQDDKVVRKAAPKDGTVKKILDKEGNLEGSWVLSWDAAEKTVDEGDIVFTGTWRYVPAPRLVIVKKIANDPKQFTDAHGEQSFMFKATGKDSGKTWYKSITFSKEAVDAVNKDGYFAGPEGTQFKLSDGYIYGTCNSIYVPEDDYIVEEIASLRFNEIKAEARYHGQEVKLIGASERSITVPLKLSSYKPGDNGFDAAYASVYFENEKVRWDKFSHTDIVINSLTEH